MGLTFFSKRFIILKKEQGKIVMELDRFETLEQKVGRLIEGYIQLKLEHRKLAEELKSKESELSGLKERLNKLDSEKGRIKQKVEGILEKIDGLIQSA